MNISTKQRSWILGIALLLTIAATAAVNSQDDADTGVVHRDIIKHKKSNPIEVIPRDQSKEKENSAVPEMSSALLLVDQVKRPAFSETVKDMFPSKSWFVPPPQAKIVTPHPVPTVPPFTYQYIGKMIEDGNRSAVFLENKSRIFVVHSGDTIESKYRVDVIEPPVMTLTYLPLNIKQTVQIGEVN